MGYVNSFEIAYNWDPFVSILREGKYTGSNLASAIQDLLMGLLSPSISRLYQPARGTISIEAKSEGMGSHRKFYIPSDFGITTWMGSTDSDYPWKDSEGNIQAVEVNNLKSNSGVLRNADMITIHLESECYRSYESGFIDLLNVHNVLLHCPTLGHFNSIGVRGESIIIRKYLYLHHSVI